MVKDSGKLKISGSTYGILAMHPNMSLNVSGNANVDIDTLSNGLFVSQINISDNAVVSAIASQSGPVVEANAIVLITSAIKDRKVKDAGRNWKHQGNDAAICA